MILCAYLRLPRAALICSSSAAGWGAIHPRSGCETTASCLRCPWKSSRWIHVLLVRLVRGDWFSQLQKCAVDEREGGAHHCKTPLELAGAVPQQALPCPLLPPHLVLLHPCARPTRTTLRHNSDTQLSIGVDSRWLVSAPCSCEGSPSCASRNSTSGVEMACCRTMPRRNTTLSGRSDPGGLCPSSRAPSSSSCLDVRWLL